METKISKVTNVTGNGSWNSAQYGTFYKFEVSFENGDVGEYSSKSQNQDKFVVGQEAAYTLTIRDTPKGDRFYQVKPAQQQAAPQGGGYGKPKDPETEKRIARMSVLKAACDLVIAGEVKLHDLTYFASILENYVLTGQDTVKAVYYQASEKSAQSAKKGAKMGNIEANFMNDAIDHYDNENNDPPF